MRNGSKWWSRARSFAHGNSSRRAHPWAVDYWNTFTAHCDEVFRRPQNFSFPTRSLLRMLFCLIASFPSCFQGKHVRILSLGHDICARRWEYAAKSVGAQLHVFTITWLGGEIDFDAQNFCWPYIVTCVRHVRARTVQFKLTRLSEDPPFTQFSLFLVP